MQHQVLYELDHAQEKRYLYTVIICTADGVRIHSIAGHRWTSVCETNSPAHPHGGTTFIHTGCILSVLKSVKLRLQTTSLVFQLRVQTPSELSTLTQHAHYKVAQY